METDRQTDKTTRWAFTAYEAQWELFKVVPEITAEQGWQVEKCPDTGRLHFQGYIRTKRQCRFAQLKRTYPGVHIEPAREWFKLVQYCKKAKSAVDGVHVNMKGTAQMTMVKALVRLASFASDQFRQDAFDSLDPVRYNNWKKDEFWMLVRKVLADDPDAVGLYVNNMYISAWTNTRSVWIELYEKELEEEHLQALDEQQREFEASEEFLTGTSSETFGGNVLRSIP